LLTFLFTSWGRVLLEKLTGSHLVKKFPELYGTREVNIPYLLFCPPQHSVNNAYNLIIYHLVVVQVVWKCV